MPEAAVTKHRVRDRAKSLAADVEARSHGTMTAKSTDGLGRRATSGNKTKPQMLTVVDISAPCDNRRKSTEKKRS